MEWNENYVIWFALLSLISLVWHLRKNSHRGSKLPPGPKGWPLFGNLFDLGSLPHRSLEALKKEYGPVVWMNLGPIKTMVILSAGAAEELFKNHDLTFADRCITDSMRSHDYYKYSMLLGAYSSYWRTLRRICTVDLFTIKRLNETALVRERCVDELIIWIEKEIDKGASGGIEVRRLVFAALFNIIGNLTLSRDFMDPHSMISSEFCNAVSGINECLLHSNISDLFPWLSRLDLQGIRRKMDRHLGKAIEITSGYVKERVEQRQQKQEFLSEKKKDFLDVVLDYRGTGRDELDKLSEYQVTIFLMEMFIAGTHTPSSTTEWAMSELLQNPDQMKKAKDEIARVVGAKKKLQESDTDNLPYLQAIMEETMRLHPATPVLLPKMARQDTNFMGYNIPKNTKVLVNIWATGRDEENWKDALSFKPERFLNSIINSKGQNYELLPFGAGRRICPGIPLAHRLVPLVLGSFLHHFEWELCDGQKKIDMTEILGVTSTKREPLRAIPKRKTV